MDNEYQEWLQKTIQSSSDYQEPTVAELIELMEAMPSVMDLEEGWNRVFDY